jgi:phosphoribosylformylglycinamidine synthase
VRLKGTPRALAMSVDGNGRYCFLDPRRGAMLAVAESARNVACAGAIPVGATNNLNFGNPERPEIMWQLVEAVEGMAEACRTFGIPITGGNVSLYNETDGRPIFPTPVIGVVGLIEDTSACLGRVFPEDGLEVAILGDNGGGLGGSEYLSVLHRLVLGEPPRIDLERERALQRLLPAAAREGLVRSAQDASEGGLAVALAECCFGAGGRGVAVDLPAAAVDRPVPRANATLFGESAGLVIVSVAPGRCQDLLRRAAEHRVPAAVVGRTGGDRIRIDVDGTRLIDESVAEAEAAWADAIADRLERQVA